MNLSSDSKSVLEAMIAQRMRGAFKSLAAAGVEITDVSYRIHPIFTDRENGKLVEQFVSDPSITEEG